MSRLLPFVIALTACGKVNTLSDAPQGDGNGADSSTGIDANTIDADPHGSITVIVNDPSPPTTPLAGVPVVFVDPAGAIIAEVATDANGKASAVILPGSTVTAVYNAGTTNVQLETVLAVAPGDTITIGPQYQGQGSGSGSFTVDVPDYPGSQSYDVYGPCGSSNGAAAGSGALSPVVLGFSDNCTESKMDLVAIALNSDHNPDAWLENANVAYTDGGSATLTGTWQPFMQWTATFTNMTGVSLVYVNDMVPDANGYQRSGYAQPTLTLDVPGAATALVETDFTHQSGGGQEQMYEVVDGHKATYDVDVQAALLPFIGYPTLDLSSATISIPFEPGGNDGDVLQVQAGFSRVVNDVTHSYSWEIWSPPTASITLPPMPSDLADTEPTANDSTGNGYATLYGADAITDWSQVRGTLFSAWDAYFAGRSTIAAGRLVESFPTGVGFTGPGGSGRARRARRR
jgi:hypothetical protein